MEVGGKASVATEPVRLLVWDLDETFWRGTLTEGGIALREDTIAIVKELARRGIVSSICSKNDFAEVRRVLEAAKVWDYFVFPSISWEPKGPRMQALVDDIQLRAPTIMFIDDNPLNLAEARSLCPGLQTRTHEYIPEILNDPLFAGKPDPDMERLKRYQRLQQRKADEKGAVGDMSDFLRGCDIRVSIDHAILDRLDRAVELINRTNQLNFTKRRLPEDPAAAREALRGLLSEFNVRAGLVRVRDIYGDHGWSGLYVLRGNVLVHFAFSCRILGMKVESWLYDKLGRPHIDVAGPVLTDVKKPEPIDWIRLEEGAGEEADFAEAAKSIERFVARGGCDLLAVAHYFQMISGRVVGEFNVARRGADMRVDHSVFLRQGLDKLSEAGLALAERFGYKAEDFYSDLFRDPTASDVWLLSFWSDIAFALYRSKRTGLTIPYPLQDYNQRDARQAPADTPARTPEPGRAKYLAETLALLREEFDFLGVIDEAAYKQNLAAVFAKAAPSTRVYVLLANEYYINEQGVGQILKDCGRFNAWTREAAKPFANVVLLHIRDFVRSESEVQTQFHFDRTVYLRAYEFIAKAVKGEAAAGGGWAIHEAEDPEARLADCRDADVLTRVSLFLSDRGRPDVAERLARRARELAPDVARHAIAYGEAAVANRSAFDPRRFLEMALRPERTPFEVHKIGVILAGAGHLGEAERVFRVAVEREPGAFVHRHRLANLLAQVGRVEETYRILTQCLAEGDTNPHVKAHVDAIVARHPEFAKR